MKLIIETGQHDTSICNAYLRWGEEIYMNNPDAAIVLWQKAYDLAKRNIADSPTPTLKKSYLFALADALNNIGAIYDDQGDITQALEYHHKSLKIQEDLGNKNGIANSLNNIGFIYDDQGDIPRALEYYHRCLKIDEELGNKSGIAASLNNIGVIYNNQGDIPNALEYYHKSLKMLEDIGHKEGVALSLNNLGAIYMNQPEIPKALEYYQKSLKLYEDIGDKKGIALSLNNIGLIYNKHGDPSVTSSTEVSLRVGITKALEYYHESLKIREDIGNKNGIALSLNNLGSIELDQGRVTSALNYAMRGLEIAQEIGSPDLISRNSGLLSNVAKKQGNFEEALEMYELHIVMRDSIRNEDTQRASIRQQAKYEFEKALLLKEQEEKETARLEAEATSRRDNLQYSIVLITLLAIGGLVAMLGRLSLPDRVTEGLIFFAFLIFFEFILVLGDPYVEEWTGGAPGPKLLINAGVAALIFPLHAFFESKLKRKLVKASSM
ncbi:MAG: tetratricopeptide repeat protein [Flavobacteriales bacterium]|nr:tetratricopeptide repeat protein [Flavobacteriales bacterium]